MPLLDPSRRRSFRLFVSLSRCLPITLLLIGCTHPSEDNIRLRKFNQDLNKKLITLTEQNDAKQRTIDGLQQRNPTIPTLPPGELNKFWLTKGLQFGQLSGGVNLDDKKPGDQAVRVYICPTDEFGARIQAAGSFVVEFFDLGETANTSLGRWEWNAIDAKSQWRSFLFEFGYELNCPWQKVPKRSDITVKVTFTDELTHIPFTAQTVVHVNIPPTPGGAPTTAASR